MSNLTSFKDLTEHLLDFCGGNPGGDANRDARRAAGSGLLTLARSASWSYYLSRGRVTTNAPYSTGTVAFDWDTRLLTLDGGVFPVWAAQARVVLGDLTYRIVSRINDLQVKLAADSSPGEDLPAGSSFTVYRDTYPLPIDCTAVDRAQVSTNYVLMQYVTPQRWLEPQRLYRGPAMPRWYTVWSDPSYLGVLALSVYPSPDDDYEIQFTYNRQPRALKTEAYVAGRVSVLYGTTLVTGTGTLFDTCLHTGAVIRFSNSATLPTSDVGANPASFERIVVSVDSPTQITIDQPAPADYNAVAYVLSDLVDVEPLAMKTALLRVCEYQLAISRNRRDRAELEQEWTKELIRAREADSRNKSSTAEGHTGPYPYRLAQMPYDPST